MNAIAAVIGRRGVGHRRVTTALAAAVRRRTTRRLVRLAVLLLRDAGPGRGGRAGLLRGRAPAWRRIDERRPAPAYLRQTVVNRSRSRAAAPRRRRPQPPEPAPGRARRRRRRAGLGRIGGGPSSTRSRSCRAASARCSSLRYYLDLSEREIAETLGISQGAVKSHASRGAAALRHHSGDLDERPAHARRRPASLLHDAVVRRATPGSLDEILDKDQEGGPVGHDVGFPPVVAAAAVVGLAIGGASGSPAARAHEGAAGPTGPRQQPERRADQSAAPCERPVYYVGDDCRRTAAVLESHQVTGATGPSLAGGGRRGLDAAARRTPTTATTCRRARRQCASASTAVGPDAITSRLRRIRSTRPAGMSAKDGGDGRPVPWCGRPRRRRRRAAGPLHRRRQHADQVLGVDDHRAAGSAASADSVLSTVSRSPARRPGRHRPTPTFKVTGPRGDLRGQRRLGAQAGRRGRRRNGYTTAPECCTLSPYPFTVKTAARALHPRGPRRRRVRRRGRRHQPGHQGHHRRVTT